MPDRPTAADIHAAVLDDARLELERSTPALAFSGLFSGATLGFSTLAVAWTSALVGAGPHTRLFAALVYPIGFIAVIVGRAQLFTENTLYPVVLVLTERRHVVGTLRLWLIVGLANLVGAALFALLAGNTSVLDRNALHALSIDAQRQVGRDFVAVFWSGLVAGWLIAMVAWLVSASDSTTGRIFVIWLLLFVIGVGGFAHCIATSCSIITTVVAGATSTGDYLRWLAAAALGNIAGGVAIVSLLNVGQVVSDR